MMSLTARWQQASFLQKLGLLLAFVSYGLLYPGVTEPIMTLSASLNLFGLQKQLFHETRSIWETVETLFDLGYGPVGLAIVLFSVIIPLGKLSAILVCWLKNTNRGWQIIAHASKWSMADVFVVAILVSFFTAKATAELNAELESGFYWFGSFCLLSIVSGQLLAHTKN